MQKAKNSHNKINLAATLVFLFLGAARIAAAEDLMVPPPDKKISLSSLTDKGMPLIDNGTLAIKFENATTLLQKLIPTGLKAGFYVIHTVVWNAGKVKEQHWYVHNTNSRFWYEPKWNQARFEKTRIYGASKLIFVSIQLGLDNTVIAYRISIKKKVAAPLQNLAALLGTITGFTPAAAAEVTYGVYEFDVKELPADITVAGLTEREGEQKEFGKQTYDNEGRYIYDTSFTVPLNSYKDIEFDNATFSASPKTVTRENVYATANLYLPRIDTKETQFRYIPHLLAGVPIKTKPLHHLMIGAGVGLNWVEPFAGIVFNRRESPNPSGGDSTVRYVRKFVWGINIPLSTGIKAFKK